MTRENVELVRNAFGAYKALTLEEAALAYWDPEVEYVEDPRWPGASRYKGRDSVLACFQSYMEALGPIEDGVVTVERVVDAGERVVPFIRRRGRSVSGVPHEHLWAYVVEIRDGRITYFRAYYDATEALDAVGAVEER